MNLSIIYLESRIQNRLGSRLAGTLKTDAESMSRLDYVQKAWDLAQLNYVRGAIIRNTSAELVHYISSILPALLSQVKTYLVVMASFAFVGGVLCGYASGGTAALSCAALGAKIGAILVTWFFSAMGIGFLAKSILIKLDDIGSEMLKGIRLAWSSKGSKDTLSKAAMHMAESIGLLFAAFVMALSVLLLRKGSKHTRSTLNRTKYGRLVSSKLLAQLEVDAVMKKVLLKQNAGSVVSSRVATALEFFEANRNRLPDPTTKKPLDNVKRNDYLKAMDFSKPVEVVRLEPGTKVIGYMNPEFPFGKFATKPGTYHNRIGISPVGREPVVYKVKNPVYVLRSRAAGITQGSIQDRVKDWKESGKPNCDRRDFVYAEGGGVQYTVPDMHEYFEIHSTLSQ